MKRSLFLTLLICCFAHSLPSIAQSREPDTVDVYLVKERWHTGIMFRVDDFTISTLPVLNYFEEYEYVDIGWGDADFYQTPGFDLFLATKAILIPTPTVIRIDGYNFQIDRIIKWREFALKFSLPRERFLRLVGYIKNFFVYDESNLPIVSKREGNKPVIFFKSLGEYHLLRTCNTWAAQALQSTGIDVDTFGLVSASQLYYKLAPHGVILKRFD